MFRRFLDPKNDFAFKKVFGTEKNKDILIHFINDIITFKENSPIASVTFLKTTLDAEVASKKTSMVDILCKDEKGNQYIVEMQVAKEDGFDKRAQYYASKVYVSQAKKAGEYHDLKEVIFLAISDYVVFPNKEAYKSDHVTLDKITNENDLKDFSYTFIELPKFKKDINQLESMTDKWIYFFKHADEVSYEEMQKLIGDSEIIEKAYIALDSANWDDEELRSYDQAEKIEGTYKASMVHQYKEGIEAGKVIGMEEGKVIGIEIGEERGIRKNKIETACNLIELHLPLDTIASTTGLSIEEVTNLANEKSKAESNVSYVST